MPNTGSISRTVLPAVRLVGLCGWEPVADGDSEGVDLTTASQRAGGFVAGMTITNTGRTAINGWTLALAFPGDQHITSAWNGTATQSGENLTITNASYNGAIAPGGNTSVGFQGTWTTSDAPPARFTLNDTNCTT
jgi:cellulase/cellobiase CelA1